MQTPILAAEYTNGSKSRPAMLDIARITNGQRDYLEHHVVGGKAEARRIAKARGATPWNF